MITVILLFIIGVLCYFCIQVGIYGGMKTVAEMNQEEREEFCKKLNEEK